MLIDGKWSDNWHPFQASDKQGGFIRQTSEIRHWITPDGGAGPTGDEGFKAEPGRYLLYVALICPWASRTLMALQLKGLGALIDVAVVEPCLTDQGWKFGQFPGSTSDTLFDADYLHEIYTIADPVYTGRATVPVLWDKKQKRMVNNESADIVRMLNTAFDHLGANPLNLYPEELAKDIDQLNQQIYDMLNNGVYRAGFAQSQEAYEQAVDDVFSTLELLEQRLGDQHYLHGEQITETDIRLFVTLVRFDLAYHGLFKCNARTLASYRNLSEFTHRIYHQPGIADTVNVEHIIHGYYSVKALNPTGIIPVGPRLMPWQNTLESTGKTA